MLVETAQLPLRLATSNENKLRQFRKVTRLDTSATPHLFDEEQIKQEIPTSPDNGIDYVGAISRKKLEVQRQRARETEGNVQDYAIIVSDSIILLNNQGRYKALNRDGNNEESAQRALETINRNGEITFVGAVSFGRKNGNSIFTVGTFLTLPLGEPLESLPVVVDRDKHKKDPSRLIRYGYIKYAVAKDGVLAPNRQTVGQTQDFEQVRPYVSGLTEDVISFANDVTKFDSITSPVTEDIVANFSFNTLAFYSYARQKGAENDRLQTHYEDLARNYVDFLQTQGGGNCALLSLELAARLENLGLEPKIASYSSAYFGDSKSLENGHSGVIAEFNGRKYLFDPGLSVSFPIPYGDLPLFPFFVGGNKSFIIGLEEGDNIPAMHILKKDGSLGEVKGFGIYTPEQFKENAGSTLTRLHDLRTTMKVDYHGADGRKLLGLSVDRKTMRLSIKINGSDKPLSMDLREIFSETDTQRLANIERLCEYCGINPNVLLSQLRSLI